MIKPLLVKIPFVTRAPKEMSVYRRRFCLLFITEIGSQLLLARNLKWLLSSPFITLHPSIDHPLWASLFLNYVYTAFRGSRLYINIDARLLSLCSETCTRRTKANWGILKASGSDVNVCFCIGNVVNIFQI